MVEQLFGSKTRVKLLQMFYGNPNRSFYVREITRKIDEQINSVRRELNNLLSIGIISSDSSDSAGNRLYYEVNQKYEYYDPLQTIFGGGAAAAKTKDAPIATSSSSGSASADADSQSLNQSLKALGNVELALYTGQFTRDERSGVDMLIVGDVNPTQVNKYVAELEKQEGKDIRFVVMQLDEFKYRQQVNDRFLATVLESKKQVLLDRHNLLGKNSENSEDNNNSEGSDTGDNKGNNNSKNDEDSSKYTETKKSSNDTQTKIIRSK